MQMKGARPGLKPRAKINLLYLRHLLYQLSLTVEQ